MTGIMFFYSTESQKTQNNVCAFRNVLSNHIGMNVTAALLSESDLSYAGKDLLGHHNYNNRN